MQRTCRKVETKKRECRKDQSDDEDGLDYEEKGSERPQHMSLRDVVEGIGTNSSDPSVDSAQASPSSTIRSVPVISEGDSNRNESTSVQEFRAPEAPMVRNLSRVHTVSAREAALPRRPTSQRNMGDISSAVNLQHDESPLRGSAGSVNAPDPVPATSAAIEVDTHENSPANRKRRRLTIDVNECTSFSSLQNKGKLKPVRQIRRKGSSSGLSRIHLLSECRNNGEHRQSPVDDPSIPDSSDQVTTVGNENSTTESTANRVNDVDSVLGDEAVAEVEEQETGLLAMEGTHSSLIVRLKLSSIQATHLRNDRRRLAYHLSLCFDTDAQAQSPCKKTMDLIRNLWSSDQTRLRESLNHAFKSYDTALSRWQRCIEIFTTFQERTQFRGESSTWNAHLGSLQINARREARRNFLDAVVQMGDWLDELSNISIQRFSDDVAVALLTMADWVNTMNEKEDRDAFIEVVARFNKSLLDPFM
ncbi:hypothetical protein BKA63DRAFT_153945 [Paraphoma chrysanthemicola]|nr:hypothetical protein BKA63DRAFT_153945 [Paraphoma chrysanthemicola]